MSRSRKRAKTAWRLCAHRGGGGGGGDNANALLRQCERRRCEERKRREGERGIERKWEEK